MWEDLFRDAIHPEKPPRELKKGERRRYFVAYGVFFALVTLVPTMGFVLGVAIVFGFHGGLDAIWRSIVDTSYSRELSGIWVPVAIGGGLLGFVAANSLWNRLFVKSGYLNEVVAQRMHMNRAPTERGEKIRVGFGYVLYLGIFLGLGVSMLIFGERTPLQIFSSLGMIGMGIYVAVHAFLRYRNARKPNR
jgi:hypothetical protein